MNIDWISVGAVLLMSLGHASLVIALENRLNGLKIPFPQLHWTRIIHDVLIVTVPAAFVWFAGFAGPGLLFGGDWNALPWIVLAWCGVCLLAALAIPIIALKRCLQLPPRLLQVCTSRTHDIAERLGYRPIGRGPYSFMVHIPRNEFLQVEFSEQQYALPRLPASWSGLSILHLTDFHFIGTLDRAYFEEVLALGQQANPDLIVFTGDLLDRREYIDWLPATLGRLQARLGCYFILGNHDWYLGDTTPTRDALKQLGWQDVAGRTCTVRHRGETLLIAGTEAPWMGTHPNMAGAPQEAFRLLLSHTPDNIGWARQNEFDLMLAGHNHGGQVRLPGYGPVYSPSLFGCRYASGSFFEPPTLMYVGRGLGGRHPWRWNCLPEITRLVLVPQTQMIPVGDQAALKYADPRPGLEPAMSTAASRTRVLTKSGRKLKADGAG